MTGCASLREVLADEFGDTLVLTLRAGRNRARGTEHCQQWSPPQNQAATTPDKSCTGAGQRHITKNGKLITSARKCSKIAGTAIAAALPTIIFAFAVRAGYAGLRVRVIVVLGFDCSLTGSDQEI
jgi:hypothetical protein